MPHLSRPLVIADDDPDDLFFARRILQKAGITDEILACPDGREVVALLEKISAEKRPLPWLVFLDVKMPQLNGFETLRWIRAQKAYEAVPVVMLSGSKEPRDVEMARSLGANDYLVKYPSAAELARVLAEIDRPKLAVGRV